MLLEGKRIDAVMVHRLSKIPGRQELLAQIAGGLKQPATKMASAMEATIVKLARAFSALADKLDQAEEAAT